MTRVLAGDIGGTKTILRLIDTQLQSEQAAPQQTPLHEYEYVSREFPDLAPMVQRFLEEAREALNEADAIAPERACFAIAGPVVKDTCRLTNLSWTLDARQLERTLDIPGIRLINDFVAVGYGTLGLSAQDLVTLQDGEPESDDPIAVIGAGTGLGQGFLIKQQHGYVVYPSEGGHVDFAPRSELEFQLLKYLLERYNISHISAERVVSGMGIVAIYQFLRDTKGFDESPEVQKAVRTWEQETGKAEKTVDPAAMISQAALGKRDFLSEKTMQMFIEAYGAEAGNLALKLLPYGGLYIAGGIAAKVLELMQSGTFMQAFQQKGRMDVLMERVPVKIITNPQVGLIGAGVYAATLIPKK